MRSPEVGNFKKIASRLNLQGGEIKVDLHRRLVLYSTHVKLPSRVYTIKACEAVRGSPSFSLFRNRPDDMIVDPRPGGLCMDIK